MNAEEEPTRTLPRWYKALPVPRITDAAFEHGLDPDLIASIVMIESGGVAWATRFEPKIHARGSQFYFFREWASRLHITPETEAVHQATSWGLMQVMGFNARRLGFDGHLVQLCDVKLSLRYGCLILKELKQRYGSDESSVVAAYNYGHARKTEAGMYVNQRYVDRVFARLHELRSLSRRKK